MALVCEQITEWIEEEVSKPVEEWEERQEEKCKKRPWYDPRGWVCWLVTTFVKVVRWVTVTVGKWVTRTVCKIVSIFAEAIRDIFAGLWDIGAGIVTLDGSRIADGFIGIVGGFLSGFFRLLRIAILLDTLEYILDKINEGRLKRYVRFLLESRYSGRPAALGQVKDAIRLDHGAFGLRMDALVLRTILDSEQPSPTVPAAPNLVVLHEGSQINLRALCGFENDEGYWNRKRYKTLKKGPVVGGGGGEPTNPISEDELDTYLSSRGAQGPAFFVLPVTDTVLDRHVSTAEEKSRELGLMLSFSKGLEEITMPGFIVHNETQSTNVSMLATVANRTLKTMNDSTAASELCRPVALSVFRYTDSLRGLASTLRTSACGLSGRNASGVTYIDNQPDIVWKYVLVHELGHYFGLCHVDGLDRIMYSSKQNSWWRWQVFPNLLFVKGEPYFTLSEAKAVWQYVVDHFSDECLGVRRTPSPIE